MKTTSSKIPKTNPYSDGDAPFFSACGKKIFIIIINAHMCMHVRKYVSDPCRFADEPSEYWQFRDKSNIRSSSGPLSRCVAINTRRDNVAINFGALLHEQRDYKPNYREVAGRYRKISLDMCSIRAHDASSDDMLWHHAIHNSIWADWKIFFQQHGAMVRL